ncbi:6-phosphofructokinase [Patescibacteria group bacterium]|nr:6-phosphofructokinase [Patescibacteria group bacterium]
MYIMLQGKTVLVFTGGGLAPALNSTLYGVIKAAQQQKMNILGGFFGWACLAEHGKIIKLSDFDPEPIKMMGGTFLRSSRTNPYAIPDGVAMLKRRIKENDIDYIIAIGGNDTLGAAQKLFENENIQVVGIPKTIDNDLQATYWSPGYPSAAHYAAQFSYEVKIDAAYALSRIFIIEVLGRQSGWIAAASSYGLADVIIPPEKLVSLDGVLEKLASRYKRNGNFATVVISEEAKFDKEVSGISQETDRSDSFNVKRKNFVALGLQEKITAELGVDCKALFPGNFLQTGPPTEVDGNYAMKLGEQAVALLSGEKFGHMASLVRPSEKSLAIEVTDVLLKDAVNKERYLDDTYFDFDKLAVKQKFFDYAEPFLSQDNYSQSSYLSLINRLQKKEDAF